WSRWWRWVVMAEGESIVVISSVVGVAGYWDEGLKKNGEKKNRMVSGGDGMKMEVSTEQVVGGASFSHRWLSMMGKDG
ncbi:hypothetical protein Dimus_001052, partial [Dionaea muscipula]